MIIGPYYSRSILQPQSHVSRTVCSQIPHQVRQGTPDGSHGLLAIFLDQEVEPSGACHFEDIPRLQAGNEVGGGSGGVEVFKVLGMHAEMDNGNVVI